MREGGYGGYSVDDGEYKYYLVRWAGSPWRVEYDQKIKVEENEYQLYRGEWVCEAYWLNNVPRAKFWYTVGETKIVVRMKHVLHASLDLREISEDNKLPKLPEKTIRQVIPLHPIKISEDDHDFLMDEAHRREDFDHEEEVLNNSDDEDEDEEGEEDEDEIFSDGSVSD